MVKHLRSENGSSLQVCYVGRVSHIEENLATRAGVPFHGIRTARLRGSRPWTLPYRLARVSWGTAQAIRLVDGFAPQVVLATGGYVCAPVIIAAWIRGVPSLVHLPDLAPGLAIRALARFASRVAVSLPASRSFFAPGKAVVTGYPVRPELFRADKLAARQRLGLAEREKTLLVFGGSQGSHSINVAVSEVLTELLAICQVVHISGEADEPWLRARRDRLPRELAGRYSLYAYLHEQMIDALAAADLVVGRAGAASTAEFPALALPSILIPYPYAGQHQELNADYMVKNGAAIKIGDADLRTGVLSRTVAGLFEDQEKLTSLAEAAYRLAKPQATQHIADLLREVARPDGD